MRKIQLTADIESRRGGHTHRAGASGTMVEPIGENAWLIEVRVPDETLEGGAWYETIEATGSDFRLVDAPNIQVPQGPHRFRVSAYKEERWGELRGQALTLPPMPCAEKLDTVSD